jgi:hypothetical protein
MPWGAEVNCRGMGAAPVLGLPGLLWLGQMLQTKTTSLAFGS